MKVVTFQVLEGVDKGRVYRDLPIPVTIGREEGNVLRLNDERVSRFHAKIQLDQADVILTDLDSTNGTRINGNPIQIRRLHPGDKVSVGRSTLIFGSNAEIRAHLASMKSPPRSAVPVGPGTIQGGDTSGVEPLPNFAAMTDDAEVQRFWGLADHERPSLPTKLSPSQAARISELLDFLHRGLMDATEGVRYDDTPLSVAVPFADWQKIQGVQMLLARYLRSIADPDGE